MPPAGSSRTSATASPCRCDTAASMARRLANRPAQVQALDALGAHAQEEGRVDDAAAIYAEGLRIAGEDGVLAARMQLGLANLALRRDDPDAALTLLDDDCGVADGSGNSGSLRSGNSGHSKRKERAR